MNIPEYLHGRASEILNMEADRADKERLWAVLYRLTPYRDGAAWCVCLGPNIQEGIAGFGATPVEAINNFEHAMYKETGLCGQKEQP